MQAPPLPIDETKRLQALAALRILDTLPEERFDRVTRLAAKVFNVPIALVSLVDRNRQWFKSRQGLDVSETSREISFCGHAILQEGSLVIEDALLDSRFANNPLVVGKPHIRFYAGHPIHSPDGSRIGTLCVIDRQPRGFSSDDRVALEDLAAMIDRELVLLERSTTDELTSLSNLRGFKMVAEHVLAMCRRNHQTVTAVAIDLDHFKAVNDLYGHEAGDEVLRNFGKMLFKHFRHSDVIARVGGDEFAMLCGGTNAGEIIGSLDRFKGGFVESELKGRYPDLSWSVGVADFDHSSNHTIEDLMHVADNRMYRAKSERALLRRTIG